jgi:membrane-associated protein
MDYGDFMRYNTIGAFVWVTPLTLAGYIFGDLPWVQANFGLIYLGLVVVTAIPLVWSGLGLLWRKVTGKAVMQDE